MDERTAEPGLRGEDRDRLRGPELTIVLPTYNERRNVAPMVARLDAALSGIRWEAIFVDDDSRDGTFDEVRRLAANDRRIRCIRRVGRRGLAGAFLEGALAAQAPHIVVMDADQQHEESAIPQMLRTLKERDVDVVIATRYAAGGSSESLAGARQGISRAGNAAAKTLLGVTASDPMSGFFAIRRDVVDRLADEIAVDGFKVLLDILATRRMPLRVAEVPYAMREREHGESKLDTRVLFDFIALLLSRASGNVLPQRFLLFCVVGLFGILVHLAALTIGRRMGLEFAVAQAIAALIAIASNFWLNNLLTYRSQTLRGWNALRGLVLFYLISAFGFVSNVGVATWLIRGDEAWWLAGLAGAVMSAVWNYAVSAALVWRRS
ncbi:MAG TPA: glycosyltransferase family 2 protein [Xanthobacteraceae bacterium]|nr:glycosyltransferase family 2 protein [Xanthobacteraceae bacterium]